MLEAMAFLRLLSTGYVHTWTAPYFKLEGDVHPSAIEVNERLGEAGVLLVGGISLRATSLTDKVSDKAENHCQNNHKDNFKNSISHSCTTKLSHSPVSQHYKTKLTNNQYLISSLHTVLTSHKSSISHAFFCFGLLPE